MSLCNFLKIDGQKIWHLHIYFRLNKNDLLDSDQHEFYVLQNFLKFQNCMRKLNGKGNFAFLGANRSADEICLGLYFAFNNTSRI